MKITSLKTNHINNPIGYQLDTIYLSWIVKDARGKFCKELRIVVSEDPKFEQEQIVYDSGILYNFKYSGLEISFTLKPRTRYYWKIYMLADNGDKAMSDIAYFETGKYNEKWDASWITVANLELAMPCIYKKFNVKKEIKQARMHIYGLGLYETYLNEEIICDEYLLPGYHSYDLVQEYQTFDITPYINHGKNEIKVILGNGWYKGRFVFEGGYENLYGDKVLLLAEIHINYTDGSSDKIITDNTWEAKETYITENNIYDGEVIDRTRPINQLTVLEVEESYDKLIERINLPIKKTEVFKPIRLIDTPKGETVLDFGEMITGWVEFLCNEPKGHEITLYYGEILQKGNFYNENLRTAKAEFHYITDGIGRVARPHFTYYSFRYVKVDGIKDINLDDFTAYRLMSDLVVTGNIKTSNPLVNKLFDNTMRSQKCNFLDIPTDCPQRDERLGWTGDVTIFASTSCFNMNTPAFYNYYLTNLQKEQELLDGAVPFFVPYPKPKPHHGMNPFLVSAGVSTWGDVACVLPWTLYEHYRDITMLRKHYPIMKSWVTYVEKRASQNKNPYLWQNDFQLGDWLALDNGDTNNPIGRTDPQLIASAYYFYSTLLCAKTAKELGYTADAEAYKKKSDLIKHAFIEEYFDEDNNLQSEQTQTAYSLILSFELYKKNNKEKVVTPLKELLLSNGSRLNTGFVGTGLLCPALSKHDLNDMAYTLLLNEKYPSWLYGVNLGATTIWERWNSVLEDGSISGTDMNSLNHYAYGCIVDWMYRYMCGFNPSTKDDIPMKIKPMPDARIEKVSGVYESAFGTYKIDWAHESKSKIRYKVQIPFNTNAEVILPDGRHFLLEAGNYEF